MAIHQFEKDSNVKSQVQWPHQKGEVELKWPDYPWLFHFE